MPQLPVILPQVQCILLVHPPEGTASFSSRVPSLHPIPAIPFSDTSLGFWGCPPILEALLHHLHCRSWCCPFKYRFPFRCSYPLICRRYSGENGGRGSRGPPLPSGRGYSVFALLGGCNLLLASELQWRNTLTTPLLLQSVASLPMI